MGSEAVRVTAPESGRLDQVLTKAFAGRPGATRSQVKQWIERGLVMVDGVRTTKAGRLVAEGSLLSVEEIAFQTPGLVPFAFPLTVLYEDSTIIVVDKPPGLAVHPGSGNPQETLVNALAYYFGTRPPETFQQVGGDRPADEGEEGRPGIVHRLDKDTSGVLVVAKRLTALQSLAAQFARHTIVRRYEALVFSTPRARRPLNVADSGTVDCQIGRSARDPTQFVVSARGRRAVTHWRVLERFQYGALVELQLETGRTHQIRVHLNHLLSPVIGDQSYGDFSGLPSELRLRQASFGRQALHAKYLEFTHPETLARVSFSSPLPSDMLALVDAFRNHGRS